MKYFRRRTDREDREDIENKKSKEKGEEEGCRCISEDDKCKEFYLLAYKCYLINKGNTVKACMKEIEEMKKCYGKKDETGYVSKILKYLLDK